jgi:hypothetical protein
MISLPIQSIKNALSTALQSIPDFKNSNYFDKGKIIDQSFKSILKDLMNQFGMQPGIDYVDNLRDNEPSTDFVILTNEADDIITGLMDGKILAISGHIRKNRDGTEYQVQAHFRKKAS